jgi:hypothetical protein
MLRTSKRVFRHIQSRDNLYQECERRESWLSITVKNARGSS